MREVDASSLEEVVKAFTRKVEDRKRQQEVYVENRDLILKEFGEALQESKLKLSSVLPETVNLQLSSVGFSMPDDEIGPSEYDFVWVDSVKLDGLYEHLRKYEYHFDISMPTAAWNVIVEAERDMQYSITFVLFYAGYGNDILGVTGQLNSRYYNRGEEEFYTNNQMIDLKPELYALMDPIGASLQKSIRNFVLSVLTVALAEITNQL